MSPNLCSDAGKPGGNCNSKDATMETVRVTIYQCCGKLKFNWKAKKAGPPPKKKGVFTVQTRQGLPHARAPRLLRDGADFRGSPFRLPSIRLFFSAAQSQNTLDSLCLS